MSKFLELVAQEKNLEAMEFFNDMMAEKISGVLDQRKAELASNLFGGIVEEVEQIDEISTRTLARAANAAADPDDDRGHDPQKYADYAKKTKDAKSAAAVQGAASGKGHYPRPGHTFGRDRLASRELRSKNPNMVTKSGKLTKTAQKGLKSDLKNEY